MKTFLKQIGQKYLNWAVNNPKKFFTYSMVFLSVSFVGTMIKGIYFSSENKIISKPPVLFSNEKMNIDSKKIKIKIEKIVFELKILKVKRDKNLLQHSDSLRVEYLYKQYQKLTNEFQKNKL